MSSLECLFKPAEKGFGKKIYYAVNKEAEYLLMITKRLHLSHDRLEWFLKTGMNIKII